MFKRKRTFAAFLILAAILGTPLRAFGADTSYVENYYKWNDCGKAQVILTDLDGYNGCMQYFYEDNCFYAHISYDEDSMVNYKNNVVVNINIENDNRKYHIEIDNHSESDNEYCKIYKSFTPDSKYGQDIYFIIEFNQKEDKNITNLLSIEISVNSHTYMLAENMAVGGSDVGSYEEENKTVKHNTTRKNSNNDGENETQSQTKFHYEGQENKDSQEQDAGSADENTGGKEKFSAGSVNGENEDEFSDENSAQEQAGADNKTTQKKSSFSTGAKAMLAGSGVIGIAGVALIIKSLVSQAIEKEVQKRADEAISQAKSDDTPNSSNE